jgi:hypothetical protein
LDIQSTPIIFVVSLLINSRDRSTHDFSGINQTDGVKADRVKHLFSDTLVGRHDLAGIAGGCLFLSDQRLPGYPENTERTEVFKRAEF